MDTPREKTGLFELNTALPGDKVVANYGYTLAKLNDWIGVLIQDHIKYVLSDSRVYVIKINPPQAFIDDVVVENVSDISEKDSVNFKAVWVVTLLLLEDALIGEDITTIPSDYDLDLDFNTQKIPGGKVFSRSQIGWRRTE